MASTLPARFTPFFVVPGALFIVSACGSESPDAEQSVSEAASRSIEEIADEFLTAWQAREDTWLAELEAIDEPADIGSYDWMTYGILHEELTASVATRICRKELWETSTTTAWYNEMNGAG